jgi:GTP-binding protein Era
MTSPETKSGFVGVLGQTNVGKSSLINSILGRKLLIVSEKRQSTRNRIRCIYNDPGAQIVFVDTPGLHKPVDRLSKYLLRQALSAVEGLDLVLYMVEPWVSIKEYDKRIFGEIEKSDVAKFLLINKIDETKRNDVPETILTYSALGIFDEIVPISCANGTNLDVLMKLVLDRLPVGPRYFSEDDQLDRPESFVIAEFIREKIYELTREEVPYSVFVEIIDIVERKDKPLVEIHSAIHVARNSQKGILVGSKGSMIKEIGKLAREDIENLLGVQVYLDLKVKVTPKWNESDMQITQALGGRD